MQAEADEFEEVIELVEEQAISEQEAAELLSRGSAGEVGALGMPSLFPTESRE